VHVSRDPSERVKRRYSIFNGIHHVCADPLKDVRDGRRTRLAAASNVSTREALGYLSTAMVLPVLRYKMGHPVQRSKRDASWTSLKLIASSQPSLPPNVSSRPPRLRPYPPRSSFAWASLPP
jgi:hypothetical protein